MGRIIEGYWVCQYCKTKVRGGTYVCPNCGKQRGEDTRFEMDDKNYVPKEEAKKISKNPDWQCSFCGSLNNDKLEICDCCGASKEDSENNYFQMKQKEEERKLERKEEVNNYYKNPNSYNSENNSSVNNYTSITSSESKPTGILNILKNNLEILGLIGFSVLLFSFFLFLFVPKNDTLTVIGMNWEREIKIEEERTVQESDWSIPAGGRELYTREEIHHYDSVLDHYETVTETKSRQVITGYEDYVTGYRDLGNGYFEEETASRPIYETEYYTETHEEPVYVQVPVYDTKYYYEIERYFYNRSVTTNGEDKKPYWGEVILAEKEREQRRVETYEITAINKKEKEKTYSLDFSNWNEINVGDVLKVKIHFGQNLEILDQDGNPIEIDLTESEESTE